MKVYVQPDDRLTRFTEEVRIVNNMEHRIDQLGTHLYGQEWSVVKAKNVARCTKGEDRPLTFTENYTILKGLEILSAAMGNSPLWEKP